MSFDSFFDRLSWFEGKDYKDLELLVPCDITNVEAKIKSEGVVVYELKSVIAGSGMNIDPKNGNPIIGHDTLIEVLYSMDRDNKWRLHPVSTLENDVSNVPISSKYLYVISKLESIYNAVLTDGVCPFEENKESLSYFMWGDGGLAAMYVDPVSNETRYFYKGDTLIKKMTRDSLIMYDMEDGLEKETRLYFGYDDTTKTLVEREAIEITKNAEERKGIIVHKYIDGRFHRSNYEYIDGTGDDVLAKVDEISKSTKTSEISRHRYTVPEEYIEDIISGGNLALGRNNYTAYDNLQVMNSSYYENAFAIKENIYEITKNSDTRETRRYRTYIHDNLKFYDAMTMIEADTVPDRSGSNVFETLDEIYVTKILKDETKGLIITINTYITDGDVNEEVFITDVVVEYKYNENIEIKVNSKLTTGMEIPYTHALAVTVNGFANLNVNLTDLVSAFDSIMAEYTDEVDAEYIFDLYNLYVDTDTELKFDTIDLNINDTEVGSDNATEMRFNTIKGCYAGTNSTFISFIEHLSEDEYIDTMISFITSKTLTDQSNAINIGSHGIIMNIHTMDIDFKFNLLVKSESVSRFKGMDKDTKEKIEKWEKDTEKYLRNPKTSSQNGQDSHHQKIIPMKK